MLAIETCFAFLQRVVLLTNRPLLRLVCIAHYVHRVYIHIVISYKVISIKRNGEAQLLGITVSKPSHNNRYTNW